MSDINDHSRFLLSVQLYDSPWEVDDCAEWLENALKAFYEDRRTLESAVDCITFDKETKLLADRITVLKDRLDAAFQARLEEVAHPDMNRMMFESIALENMAKNIRMIRLTLDDEEDEDEANDDLWERQIGDGPLILFPVGHRFR